MELWNVKRWLRSHLGKLALYHYCRFVLNRKKLHLVFKKFGIQSSPDLVTSIKEAWIKYHWSFEEYFYFKYSELNDREKRSFVPEYEKNIFCDKANDHNQDMIFHNKWKTYCKFQKFFKRDVILLRDKNAINEEFAKKFFNEHHKFIIKPINAATGRGVHVIKINFLEDLDEKLVPLLKKYGPCVAEELIEQVKSLADFNSSSVNTVRVPTFRYDSNDIIIIHPFLRLGRQGNVVDNAGAGGIMGLIDPETGVVYAASDETCHYYTNHPDTNLEIIGFKIPQWKEAVGLVKKLAEVLPKVRYVGWDIALTDGGWVLVEGNEKGQFLWQIPTRLGFREEYDKICKKANISI